MIFDHRIEEDWLEIYGIRCNDYYTARQQHCDAIIIASDIVKDIKN